MYSGRGNRCLPKRLWKLVESIKLQWKETVNEHCTLVEEIVSHGAIWAKNSDTTPKNLTQNDEACQRDTGTERKSSQ